MSPKGNYPYLSKSAECTIYTTKQCREYSIPYLGIHEINLERENSQFTISIFLKEKGNKIKFGGIFETSNKVLKIK